MKSKSQTAKKKVAPAAANRTVAKRAAAAKKAGTKKNANAKNKYKQTVKMSEGDDGQPTKA
jgi:hypothetical protein